MQYHTKEIRIVFLSLVIGLFLLSGLHSSFSQESFPDISDEDLDLLEEFFEQAQDLFEEENYEEAISFYDKVLEIDSEDIDALFGRALSLESLGREEEAISNLEKIETLLPPEDEFRVPPEGAVNQGVEDIAEFDQTLFVIIAVVIVILIIIIAIDFFAKRRKSVINS